MRIMMIATIGLFAMNFVPTEAAAKQDTVVLTWEQCHIQALRAGFNPYRRAYARQMLHCLAR